MTVKFMTRIKHPEWRDSQEFSNYPFADGSSLVNAAGDVLLPETFEDAAFYVAGARAAGYISRINISDGKATIHLGHSQSETVASGQFSLTDLPESIRFTDSFASRPAGLLVSTAEKLAVFQAWSAGDHFFTPEQSGLVAAVWMPVPETGVKGLQADDDRILTNDVYLVGDGGVQLSCDAVTTPSSCGIPEITRYVIRVDIQGDPLWRRRDCSPGFFATPRFVERITFQKGGRNHACGPGTNGDLKLYTGNSGAADTILRIRPEPGGLRIEAVGEGLEDIR